MLVAALVASACAPSRPAPRPGADLSGPPEKVLFAALKEVHATDAQRLAIFEAFDETQPQLKALEQESDAIMREWQDLDRRDPAFTAQADKLAARYGDVSRGRMAVNAAYEGRVAAALDEGQWDAWQDYWSRVMFGPASAGPGGMGGGMGPPPGGGRRRR